MSTSETKTTGSKKSNPSIGIDLGTTFSCVGTWKNGAVEIIPNDLGERTTPSYVAFTDTERLVGSAAKNQAARNAENTLFDAKRLIGRRFEDAVVQQDIKTWPFKVVADASGRPIFEVVYQGEKSKCIQKKCLQWCCSTCVVFLKRTLALK
jgi:L1 cell adhesion molecule like protein